MRNDIVEQAVRDQTFNARQRAEDAATDAGKLGAYARSIEALSKLMDETAQVAPLEQAILDLRIERDTLKFDLPIRKAEIAEAKGQIKRAVDLYIDGIMALRQDSTPDYLQTDKIEEAQIRIAELGGNPPV